ncbi:MAG: hypothetical protein K8T89_01690 [Planctomycetes bacterium]|nr:hypothetical protein [Planctomycetota bacterium]
MNLDLPWYKEWTGVPASKNKDNVKHVFDELNGKIQHERLGLNLEPLMWPGMKPVDGSRLASR